MGRCLLAKNKIKSLEEAAENLIFASMKKGMKIEIEVDRMEGAEFSGEKREVPIPKELLEEIKEIAEGTRARAIPKIKNI